MKASEPRISDFIVPCGGYVTPSMQAGHALFLMTRNGTRYLPVRAKGKTVGLLREEQVRAATRRGLSSLEVSELMGPVPATVEADTSLYRVLDETPESTYGCTVVESPQGDVLGVFSALDAVIAFKRLNENFGTQWAKSA